MTSENSHSPQQNSEYRYDINEEESICEAIIKTVITISSSTQSDPSEFEIEGLSDDLEPLHYWVDVEALEQLFAPTKHTGQCRRGAVTFTYNDYLVTVNDGTSITVESATTDSNNEASGYSD